MDLVARRSALAAKLMSKVKGGMTWVDSVARVLRWPLPSRYLDRARQVLARSGSPECCQTAIQHIRSYLRQDNVSEHTPPWEGKEKSWVIDKLGLSGDEQAEVGSPTFTALDAAHIEQVRFAQNTGNGNDTAADERADAAPLQLAH